VLQDAAGISIGTVWNVTLQRNWGHTCGLWATPYTMHTSNDNSHQNCASFVTASTNRPSIIVSSTQLTLRTGISYISAWRRSGHQTLYTLECLATEELLCHNTLISKHLLSTTRPWRPTKQSKLPARILRTPFTLRTQFTTNLPKQTRVSLWYLRRCSATRTYIGLGNWVHLAELRRCSTTRTHVVQGNWLYLGELWSPWKTRTVRSGSINNLSLQWKP
jgi:hypothetical protein